MTSHPTETLNKVIDRYSTCSTYQGKATLNSSLSPHNSEHDDLNISVSTLFIRPSIIKVEAVQKVDSRDIKHCLISDGESIRIVRSVAGMEESSQTVLHLVDGVFDFAGLTYGYAPVISSLLMPAVRNSRSSVFYDLDSFQISKEEEEFVYLGCNVENSEYEFCIDKRSAELTGYEILVRESESMMQNRMGSVQQIEEALDPEILLNSLPAHRLEFRFGAQFSKSVFNDSITTDSVVDA